MLRPLLFLDVDGPLNPYAAKATRRPEGYQTHRLTPPTWIAQNQNNGGHRVKPLRVWLNPAHGTALLKLARLFDLVWATTWKNDANTYISSRIGLPELPVVEFSGDYRTIGPEDTFYKTAELIEYAAGRPFAWVDDEIDDVDHLYIEREHPAPALPYWVDPASGLLDHHFDALASWATAINS